MAAKKKRTAVVMTSNSKKARAAPLRQEVHPLQIHLGEKAARCPGGIIATDTGTGKPRIVGQMLDTLEEKSDGVKTLVIIVTKDVKLAREQAGCFGSDYLSVFHAPDLSGLMTKLNSKNFVRIMMPQTTFRSKVYSDALLELLSQLGNPHVITVFDEVHEMYNNSKLPKAVKTFNDKYSEISVFDVFGMSATPRLEGSDSKKHVKANAHQLFGMDPLLHTFTPEEEERLLNEINSQRTMSKPKQESVALPNPKFEDNEEDLNKLTDMYIGYSIFGVAQNIHSISAVHDIVSSIVVNQVTDDDTGGKLFEHLPAQKVEMLCVTEPRQPSDWIVTTGGGYESWLIACDTPAANIVLLTTLKTLQGRPGVTEFTLHDLRPRAYKEGTDGAKPNVHNRGLSEQEMALKNFRADGVAQRSINIAVIERKQTSGSNDFSKGVSRTVAIGGAWKEHELTQFQNRTMRACALVAGDLVATTNCFSHFTSEFATRLFSHGKNRVIPPYDGDLKNTLQQELKPLKEDLGVVQYAKAKEEALFLGSTDLPGEPMMQYLSLLQEGRAQPIVGVEREKLRIKFDGYSKHHANCNRDTNGDVTKCSKECLCLRKYVEEDEDSSDVEDAAEDSSNVEDAAVEDV